MGKVIEPYRQSEKLVSYLTEGVKKIGIVFWHGLGDCVQFIHILEYLRKTYVNIKIDILLQNNLGQEAVYPEGVFLNDLNKLEELDYDYVFLVHFPVEEKGMTKAELCCKTEIGCPPIWEYGQIPHYPRRCFSHQSKIIGMHFHNTALPSIFNPSREVAEKIWNEVLENGFIPMEIDFQHPYHNPVNEKFDFIDNNVRKVKANVFTVLNFLTACQGVIAVPSGPLHCSLAMMPQQVLYMQKHVPIERFTYWNIPSIDVLNYKEGDVSKWLKTL